MSGAADEIGHLIYRFSTTENITFIGLHTVWHPALLDQIEQTVTGSTTAGQVFHAAYGSKPAGRLDSIDFLARIDKQSKEIGLRYSIGKMPLRPRLHDIAQALGATPDPMVHSWWVSARVLTQHDSAAIALNAPCPREECDMWGSIRVRFNPNMAFCVNCGSTWSDDNLDPVASFGRLAVWVQWASEHLRGPEHKECTECASERIGRSERILGRKKDGH